MSIGIHILQTAWRCNEPPHLLLIVCQRISRQFLARCLCWAQTSNVRPFSPWFCLWFVFFIYVESKLSMAFLNLASCISLHILQLHSQLQSTATNQGVGTSAGQMARTRCGTRLRKKIWNIWTNMNNVWELNRYEKFTFVSTARQQYCSETPYWSLLHFLVDFREHEEWTNLILFLLQLFNLVFWSLFLEYFGCKTILWYSVSSMYLISVCTVWILMICIIIYIYNTHTWYGIMMKYVYITHHKHTHKHTHTDRRANKPTSAYCLQFPFTSTPPYLPSGRSWIYIPA